MENQENKHAEKHPISGKKIALFILYLLIAVCLLLTVLSFNDMPSILEQLKNVKPGYIILGILMVLIYMALYPLSLCLLTKARKCDIKMTTTYNIAMTEHFFNGITPLATGGQPFQAHSYTRAKVKISESTGLLLTNLLIYMIVTTGFSLTGLFFFNTLTSHIDRGWIPIIIVGYSLNFMVLVVIVFLGTSAKLRGGLMRCIRFFCKFRLFRRFEKKADDLQGYFENVQKSFKDLMRHKKTFILALLSKIASFAFLYSSSFFILLALDIPVSFSEWFMILAGTSFAITAVGFIPTPGASGGVEGSAGQVFKSIIIHVVGASIVPVAAATANGVMLIWRLLSYYMVMLISLFFYIGLEFYFKKKAKEERLNALVQEAENENSSGEDDYETE